MTAPWMTGDQIRALGADLGLSVDEIAAELHVPLWQLNDPGFSACPIPGGGWETHWQGTSRPELPSPFAALMSGVMLAVLGVCGMAGVYALVRVLW